MDPRRETGGTSAQSADQAGRAPAPASRLAWLGGWVAALALPLWAARLAPVSLLAAAVGALWWLAVSVRRRERWGVAAALVLALSLGVGIGVQYRLHGVVRDWPRLQRAIEERGARELDTALNELVEAGERAVGGVGEVAGQGETTQLFQRLRLLQGASPISAVAVFDAMGRPLAWAGEHRGDVPLAVRRGERAYVFHEGPLFSYLYFVRPVGEGRTAVAAALLEANLSAGEGAVPFAERFARRHGLTPRFSQPERARGETVWDWSTGDGPILSVSFAALTQQHWWERVVERGRRGVGLLWLAGFVLLSIAWYRGRMGRPGVPVAVGTVGLLLLPLGEMVEAHHLYSPLQFLLPGPGSVTLGMLLVLLVGSAVWLLTRTPPRESRRRLPLWLSVGLAAALFPLALRLIAESATDGFLAGHAGGGFALQLASALLLALPLYLLLNGTRRPERVRVSRGRLLGLGLLLPPLLGLGLHLLWHPDRPLPPGSAVVWAIPFAVLALAGAELPPRWRTLRTWLLAAWLGGIAALSHLWILHTRAELANAERELARLGTVPNPFLDFLLRQFAEQALYFALEGEEGVNLLYHSWVASGLARDGYEARLTIWRDGHPETELRLSEMGETPDVVADLVAEAGNMVEPVVIPFEEVESLHYLLLVPLPGERAITVAVPPRDRVGRATALARFLYPQSEAESAASNETLHLVPVSQEEGITADSLPPDADAVRWERIDAGWRSEARARFPAGWMHAHLVIRTTALPFLLVRGILVLVALLGVFVLLWTVARALCGQLPGLPILQRQWVRSFRGRLTVTLFVFFLVPMAVFGAVAYGAVAREVVRSAGSLAQRTLEQAARRVGSASLSEVGAELGADLLLYRQGSLVGAAAPEVLDLGLFHSWLPQEVFLRFASGEDLEGREERRLAGSDYLVAYRRLDPEVVLAAPIPLASDEITRRQQEFAHIALLMSLLGAAFSVFLALLVGRALTRPLDELGRAVATVGAGNLRVRLPEDRRDEFGSVYAAFNRMVLRIRRARAALMQETRRTETIVAEAATGVLALDAERRVELVNPRASEVLGVQLREGSPIPRSGPLLDALADALDEFWRAGAAEAVHELEVDGRIVRLRLRRLVGPEEARGAVAALEDVTREVRTARVLAWGEMARQVAHEIKNPLTPIKLSVQHLRRAFTDGRDDFGEILERNVEAILREIDRLGEIARAFARFGTPQQTVAPLEAVVLARALHDTLALYRGGAGGIRYELEIDPATPPRVTARLGELKEVLVNLLENAREALDGEGEIRITVAPAPEGRVELVVADSGEGIPAELLPSIFEPHFSTRTSGTGLGLAIVRRLVESWGGEVAAEAEPGAGTRVRVLIPAADAEPRRPTGSGE